MLGCLHSWMWIRWKLNFSDMLQWIVISNLCVLQPKFRKTRNIRPCFSNSGDNTAVSQLCNFSYKTTLLPPKQFSCWTYIYARILNWMAFIVLPSSYARILSWVAFIVLPSSLPAQITSLFSSCACKFVACFFDYTYLWNLCSYYCDFKKNSWL